MRTMSSVLLLAACTLCLTASARGADDPGHAAVDDPDAIHVETVVMTDGRKIIGTYDVDKHTITRIDPKTGKVQGHMLVSPADVVSHDPLVIAIHHKAVIKPGTDGHFIEDYPAAVALAKATHRPILMNFTGSDWCPWCIKLENEVFAAPAFITWAAAHVVLFEADFPNQKQQDDGTKKQNHDLAGTWGIQGYPTVIVTDAAGAKLAQSGYHAGGPDGWIKDIEQQMGPAVK